MNKEQAILYLHNVLDKWVCFGREHKQLALAIKVLLQEVEK